MISQSLIELRQCLAHPHGKGDKAISIVDLNQKWPWQRMNKIRLLPRRSWFRGFHPSPLVLQDLFPSTVPDIKSR